MFTEIIAKLAEGNLVAVILAALVAAVLIVKFGADALVSLVHGHAPADELDTDELADRIEVAIKDATVDLLGALEVIGQATEAEKLRPRSWTAARPPYDFRDCSDTPDRHAEQAIDLTNPYQPTDLRG